MPPHHQRSPLPIQHGDSDELSGEVATAQRGWDAHGGGIEGCPANGRYSGRASETAHCTASGMYSGPLVKAVRPVSEMHSGMYSGPLAMIVRSVSNLQVPTPSSQQSRCSSEGGSTVIDGAVRHPPPHLWQGMRVSLGGAAPAAVGRGGSNIGAASGDNVADYAEIMESFMAAHEERLGQEVGSTSHRRILRAVGRSDAMQVRARVWINCGIIRRDRAFPHTPGSGVSPCKHGATCDV